MAASSAANQARSLQGVLNTLASDRDNGIFLLDGGTGEELFRRGVPDDRKIWSATAVVHSRYHTILERVHASFLQAGARAITTNSYGIVPGVGFDDPEERTRHIAMAGEIARRAVTKHQEQEQAFVLGSLGPLVESYRPDLIRAHPQGVEEYGVACRALQPYVDAFLAETMSCWEESSQALEAVSSLATNMRLPVMVSYTLDSKGNIRDGETVTECFTRVLDYAQENKLDREFVFQCYYK
jgi:S-methylmethionine-dependent homocysteine/selenocysteine methylase